MLEELFSKFDGAFAENTIRAYRADFNHFNQWCIENDIVTMDSTNENWKDYVEHCAQILSTATVGRRIASLATIFKLSGLHSFADHPDVILAMKRIDLSPKIKTMTLMRFPINCRYWRSQNEEAIQRRTNHQGYQAA
jgi:site-specific recombinase XerD